MLLRLTKAGRFGRLVSFVPTGGRFNPFVDHPLALELARRAQAAREAGTRAADAADR